MVVGLREAVLGVVEHVRADPEALDAVGLARLEHIAVDGQRVLQRAVQLVGERPGHADPDDVDVTAIDRARPVAQEADVVEVVPARGLEDLERARAGDLEEEDLPCEVLALHVVALAVLHEQIGQPGGQPVGDELLVAQAQEHPVHHDVALVVAHDRVLRGSDRELGEAVDAEVGQEPQGVRAAQHVRRRGVQMPVDVAALLPRHDLVAPAGVLPRLGVAAAVPPLGVVERDARVVRDIRGMHEDLLGLAQDRPSSFGLLTAGGDPTSRQTVIQDARTAYSGVVGR